MGETPEIPSVLSDEGIEFVECCLVHDPKQRWTASELLQHHNFCKVSAVQHVIPSKLLISYFFVNP